MLLLRDSCCLTSRPRTLSSPFLFHRRESSGQDPRDERVKQMIGHMARQIMESLGYEVDRLGMRLVRQSLFTTAARYRHPQQHRVGKMMITREQRLAWQENTARSPFNEWLDPQVKRPDGTLDLDKLYEIAKSYGITERYEHLNPGQRRMNIGIKLRTRVPKEIYEPRPAEGDRA